MYEKSVYLIHIYLFFFVVVVILCFFFFLFSCCFFVGLLLPPLCVWRLTFSGSRMIWYRMAVMMPVLCLFNNIWINLVDLRLCAVRDVCEKKSEAFFFMRSASLFLVVARLFARDNYFPGSSDGRCFEVVWDVLGLVWFVGTRNLDRIGVS